MSLFETQDSLPFEEQATPHLLLPLVGNTGNRRVLTDWIANHPDYRLAETDRPLHDTQFDLCIVDRPSLDEYGEELLDLKRRRQPVLLPCLLVASDVSSITPSTAETGSDGTDDPQLVDEVVTPPIEKQELGWRVNALLRLRTQSQILNDREAQLRESKQRLEATIDAAPNPIIVLDTDGIVTLWSDSAERVFGWGAEEAVGRHYPIVPDDKGDEFEEFFEQVLNGDWISGVETVRESAQGEMIDVRLSAAPIRTGNGSIAGAVTIIEDITEEVARQQDLRRFREAVIATDHAVYITDTDGTIEFVNPAFEEITGYTEEEALGKRPDILYSGAQDADYYRDLWETLTLGDSWTEEVINVRKSGERYHAYQTITPITDNDGRIEAFVAIQADITEEKQRRERFQAFVEHSSDVITVIDEAGEIQYESPSIEPVLGYTPEELMGESAFDIVHPDDRERVFEAFAELMERPEGATVSVEYRAEHADGSWRWAESTAANRQQSLNGRFVINTRDITERKEREDELTELFDRITDAFAAVDNQWRFTYVNERAEELIKRSAEELIGKTHWEAFPEVVGTTFETEYRRAMETQEAVTFEEYYEPIDTWFAVRAYPSESGLSIYFRDISDRKQREQELRESERRYRFLADNFPDGLVALFDEDLRYLLVGPDELPVSGLNADDMEGKTIFELFPEDIATELAPHYRAALGGEERSFETTYNDRIFDMKTVPVVQADENEAPRGMVVARDITDRIERENRLQAIDESRTLALEASQAGIWEWSPSTGEMRLHETCEQVFGLPADSFGGGFEDYLAVVHPDDRSDVEEALEQAVANDTLFDSTYRIVRPDGVERWIDGRGRMVKDRQDGPASMVGVNVDITERKERQKQLAVVGRVLRHDIRNDMNVITGWAETIQETAGEPITDYAGRILSHAQSLVDTAEKERSITELLTEEPTVRTIDLSDRLDRVLDNVHGQYPEASIAVDAPDRVPVTASINLDEALYELLENAIIHSETATPTVEIIVTETDDRIRIEIADNGPGIPSPELEVLDSDRSIDPLHHSSGMGLWLVYWIVHRSNGTLQFDDREPTGTVVTVDLAKPQYDVVE